MNSDFGHHHDHLGFAGPPGILSWLPLLSGMLVMVAVALILLILLADDRFTPTQRVSRLPSISPAVRQRWHGAVRAHAATAQQFVTYECTPAALAQRPDLADVTRPATALFIDAFADANALATDHYPGAEHAERFIHAAQRAQQAWRAAVDTSRDSDHSRSTPPQHVLTHAFAPSRWPKAAQARTGSAMPTTGWPGQAATVKASPRPCHAGLRRWGSSES